ncbi:hypothetical protein [Actinotalea sp. K2]|uniref:hypothetical protein n=1 Tax=Actinotalea sp. K2 TaxID=2939438 RepID=UPI002017F916|nr:hypothetical protein [Actinotalea sp. K2]MCL3859601.1 hypothetical protein [Actinotalea sp. K2]
MPVRPSYVELLVHGVSGTSPEGLLGVERFDQVAGDDLVRFVRASDASAGRLPGGGVLEGVSWGRLTSGVAKQAAWLVMLPFALVNLAFWTSRDLTDGDGPSSRAARPWLFRASMRLLAVTLTVLVTLAAALISMDLLAWQCAGEVCGVVGQRLTVADDWTLGTRVAVASAVPVLLLGAVAWLSHRVSLRYEASSAADLSGSPVGSTRGDEAQPDLFSPLMWNGEPLVRRLRSVHLSVGWATVALLLVWSSQQTTAAVAWAEQGQSRGVGTGLWWTALVCGALVVVAGVLLVALPTRWVSWTYRPTPAQGVVTTTLQGVALLAAVLAALAFRQAVDDDGAAASLPGELPALGDMLTVVVWVQVLLPLAVGLVLLSAQRLLNTAHRCARALDPRPGDHAALSPTARTPAAETQLPALGGFAPWVVAASGTLLGYVYVAAASLRIAELLRAPAQEDGPATSIEVPVLLQWASGGFAVVVGLGLVAGVVTFVLVSRHPSKDVVAVADHYGVGSSPSRGADGVTRDPADRRRLHREWRDDYRIRRIVRARRLQRLVQTRWIVNALAVGGVGGVVLAGIAVTSNLQLVDGLFRRLGWRGEDLGQAVATLADEPATVPATAWVGDLGEVLATAGSWALALLAAGLVALVVASWRSAEVRRQVGIVWDVLSFWPRGCHPFAPPSYTERAVPQLVARIRHLAGAQTFAPGPRVVLSAHSQGTVIALAVIAQLATLDAAEAAQGSAAADGRPSRGRTLDHVVLLTHGSPLGRLYQPLFPQYFSGSELVPRGRSVVARGVSRPVELLRVRAALGDRWINLWRDTDPIGASLVAALDDHDLQCEDPLGYLLDEENATYPPVQGHSGYPTAQEYRTARRTLLRMRRTDLPSA